jgi:hypothetical protein
MAKAEASVEELVAMIASEGPRPRKMGIIDHVFPRSWANLPGSNLKYVRLFPVSAEINLSAGAGRVKTH